MINECLDNDPIYILEDFTCCEEGIEFEWEKSRDFHVGDRVFFIDAFKDPDSTFSQDHLSWMIKFKTEDNKIYNACQLYFVHEDLWEGLKAFFTKK
ncbi:hypothetical protein AC623_08875 [Bacillus sp. FJAT-27231]|uniref:hypothetical protein n=1 Tax=Bacillus sp. FJAT-27231 TaxID=1679168 RepID=UPI000671107A|nr:hypothetical protein [Bacillus sp. FJAT-27231]KMY54065.1 hypothetical protein AC623_08875 [Bacillus sp. FJAT-27231]